MRLISIIDTVGNALILQLCMVAFSIPVVTVVPAAVALQRSLDDLGAGEHTGVVPFARHLSRAWRQYAAPGAVIVSIGVGLVVGLSFWWSIPSVVGRAGQGVLIFWGGLACAVYLSLLSTSSEHRELRNRAALSAAFAGVRAQPLQAIARTIMFLAWLLVLGFVPPLGLIGCGLVPAIIARWSRPGMIVAASVPGA